MRQQEWLRHIQDMQDRYERIKVAFEQPFSWNEYLHPNPTSNTFRSNPEPRPGFIDAGIVPEQLREEHVVSRGEWLDASADDLAFFHDVHLYANQEANVTTLFSGDVVLRIRYSTPCITSLREVGT